MEVPIFIGVYRWWEIYITKLIGLTYGWKAIKEIMYYYTVFVLFDILDMRAISKYNPPGLIFRGEI